MLDGKSQTTHSLKNIAAVGVQEGAWVEHDAQVIRYLVSVLERPITDIQKELEEQPRLRASSGFYFRAASLLAKNREDALEQMVLRTYSSLYQVKYNSSASPLLMKAKESAGKFTEKLVMATVATDPAYSLLSDQVRSARHLADVMFELREAFTSRGRFLEQYSNNSRGDRRSDREERTED
jgi:hypothetical protein